MTGEYVTKKFEQEFCGMALTWGKKNEDICEDICKYLPKSELSRKNFNNFNNFNNQGIRTIHFMDTNCPLFPATSVITHWADEQTGTGGKNGSFAWVQQRGFSLTKANC